MIEPVAFLILGFVLGVGAAAAGSLLGQRMRDAHDAQTTPILPGDSPAVSYVDAVAGTPGATWLDQVVGCLADNGELTLAHTLRRRVDRALATLRSLARPDLGGSPCWCQPPSGDPVRHSAICTTAAVTLASLLGPPLDRHPRPPTDPAAPGRYHH